jgi:predicted ABC-type sugar transport system permease subunit
MKCPHCGTAVGNNLKGARKGLNGMSVPAHIIVVYCFNDSCGKVLGVLPAS